MTLAVLNPFIDCSFGNNEVAHSTCYAIPTKNEEASFFDEQIDLTSEIMSFLDVESLLNVCQTSKLFSACLRYDHVITSALKLTSGSSPLSSDVSQSMSTIDIEKKAQHLQEEQSDRQCGQQARESRIMKRLLQVFAQYNSIKSTKSGAIYTMTMQNVEIPSPMRLLRLVNGKNCERCNRRLSVSSNGGSIILPSLTFGKFCCTKCLFE